MSLVYHYELRPDVKPEDSSIPREEYLVIVSDSSTPASKFLEKGFTHVRTCDISGPVLDLPAERILITD